MKLPYAPLEFTDKGALAKPAQVDDALKLVGAQRAADVLVIAHGWNNDLKAAEALYRKLGDNVAGRLRPATKLAVVGVIWPSLRWADDDAAAGGGASATSAAADEAALAEAIDASATDEQQANQLKDLADALDTPAGRAQYVAALRDALPPPVKGADEDPAPAVLRTGDPDQLFELVRVAVLGGAGSSQAAAPEAGDSAPGVSPDLLSGGGPAATEGAGLFGMSWSQLGRQVLNTSTYYTMKARAGSVGADGVAPFVNRLNAEHDVRVHLAGHSFGGRVMAAAATNVTSDIASLTLLQAAFSHFGFTHDYGGSGKDGAFRGALANGRIKGPIAVTHTRNDKAVGLAYAIASRLAGQAGAAIGGPDDPYGGIGANGSLGTDAVALVLGDPSTTYTFTDGRVHNLRADATIHSHSDVSNEAVANALAAVMRLS
jgi:hypothetical protein